MGVLTQTNVNDKKPFTNAMVQCAVTTKNGQRIVVPGSYGQYENKRQERVWLIMLDHFYTTDKIHKATVTHWRYMSFYRKTCQLNLKGVNNNGFN